MLSRVANSIYWMGRYCERADNVARFLDVNLYLKMEAHADNGHTQWEPLVRASGDEQQYQAHYSDYAEKDVLKFLVFDEENDNSIYRSIERARENARTIREIIPTEQWEALNGLYHGVEQYRRKRSLAGISNLLKEIKTVNNLCTGYIQDIMLHDQAWHFYQCGKMLERADKTLRILDIKYFLMFPESHHVGSPYDAIEWGAVLKSLSGFQMYRQRFHRVNYLNVADFLIFDALFPRSLKYSLQHFVNSLKPIAMHQPLAQPVLENASQLLTTLSNCEIKSIFAEGLHEKVDDWQCQLNDLDDQFHMAFFSPKPPPVFDQGLYHNA